MEDKIEHSTRTISRNAGWSELPVDLCAKILSRLSPKNILRFKLVCRSWFKAVEYILSSSSSIACLPEQPWFFVDPQDRGNSVDNTLGDRDRGFCFYSLEGKVYNLKNMPEELRQGVCLGSSHGFLLFLKNKKQKLELLLLNPLSGNQIPLPGLITFPDILGIKYSLGGCTIKFIGPGNPTPRILETFISRMKDLRQWTIKAVLSERPSCSNRNNIGVLVMYNFRGAWSASPLNCNLAFCRTGDHEWTKLDEHRWYMDIMSYHNHFYALRDDYSVEIWDCSSSFPSKKMEIRPDALRVREQIQHRLYRPCIIKTTEDLLLVVTRRVSSLSNEIAFHVYKLEYFSDGETRWTEVESIGTHALALGASQSIFISCHDAPQCDADSIYFKHTPFISSHHPHHVSVFDLSVFNLGNKGVEKLCDLPIESDEPGVFWVDPNPLY